jgi:hypothetical protein
MKFFTVIVLILDLLAIYRVIKDETYLFDKEKPKYIFWILLIPIVGAIVAMRKIGYRGFFMKHMGRSEMLYPDVELDPHETDEDRIRRERMEKLGSGFF